MDKIVKTHVQIYCLVLENDGSASCLAAAISCASMALVNANIEMYATVVGSACGALNSGIFLDPTMDEENEAKGIVVLAAMPALNQVTHLIQTGEMSADVSTLAISLCDDACAHINTLLCETYLAA
jgi:exosome complex component MTR3